MSVVSLVYSKRCEKGTLFPQGKHTFGRGLVFKGHIINSCKEPAPLNIARWSISLEQVLPGRTFYKRKKKKVFAQEFKVRSPVQSQ